MSEFRKRFGPDGPTAVRVPSRPRRVVNSNTDRSFKGPQKARNVVKVHC